MSRAATEFEYDPARDRLVVWPSRLAREALETFRDTDDKILFACVSCYNTFTFATSDTCTCKQCDTEMVAPGTVQIRDDE